MKNRLLPLFMLVGGFAGYGQVIVGGTEVEHKSAQLEVKAADKGILIPQVKLTSSTDASTINGGNVNSLLVFNTADTLGIKPGYYYWYDDKWNRVLISSETPTAPGIVIYNPITQEFNYIDESGKIVKVDLTKIVKASETVTTLTNDSKGKYTYTNEADDKSVIDVVKDVIDNSKTIFNDKKVTEEITKLIESGETLTSLVFDKTANTLKYTAEDGKTNTISLTELVANAETLTSLQYNEAKKTLTYNAESGDPTVIKLDELVGKNETVTSIVSTPRIEGKRTNEIGTYANEVGTPDSVSYIEETITEMKNTNLDGNPIGEFYNEVDVNPVIIKETVTKLNKDANGKYTYIDEAAGQSEIDVAQDVADNFLSIAGKKTTNGTPTVREILKSYTYEDEIKVKLEFDPNTNMLTLERQYPNGLSTDSGFDKFTYDKIDLSHLITTGAVDPKVLTGNTIATYKSAEDATPVEIKETLTALTYDAVSNKLAYKDENGDSKDIDLTRLITKNETVTLVASTPRVGDKRTNEIATYANEVGTPESVSYIEETVTEMKNTNLDGNPIGEFYNEVDVNPVIIKETVTKLNKDADGKYTYINEAAGQSEIDVVQDVANNFVAMLERDTPNGITGRNTLQDLTRIDETKVKLEFDPITNMLTLERQHPQGLPNKPEADKFTYDKIDLSNLITTAAIDPKVLTGNTIATYKSAEDATPVEIKETLTSLNYDATANKLTYQAEKGLPNDIDLTSLVAKNETVTTMAIPSNSNYETGNTIATYTNEDKDAQPVEIKETITVVESTDRLGDRRTNEIATYANEVGTPESIAYIKETVTEMKNTNLDGNPIGEFYNELDVNPVVIKESVTTLDKTSGGIYLFTNEKRDESEINIIQDVADDFATIAGYPTTNGQESVRKILKRYNYEDQTKVSLEFDPITKILTLQRIYPKGLSESEADDYTYDRIDLSSLSSSGSGDSSNETITEMVPVITEGHNIASYTNESNESVDIKETVTTMDFNISTSKLTFTDEAGSNQIIDLSSLKSTSNGSASFLKAGTNVTIAGTGTSADPYIVEAIVPREVLTEIAATDGQTSFTLEALPAATSKVVMYINGVRINKESFSISGTTVTYNPILNGNNILVAADAIMFEYSK